jgi:DNA-binding protein YbaB
MNMFDKLREAQQQADEIKRRLDSISVMGEVEGGKIRVISTANRQINEIKIDPQLYRELDQEAIEELLIVATNLALRKADEIHQVEMQAMSKEMLGSMGGLGALANLFGK